MRLTIRTNLAMRTLMACAVNPGRILRKQDVAQSCNASENHLAQVIHLMAQNGFLVTQRGRSGGFRLARPARTITVGQVFRVFEATLPFTECQSGAENTCPLTGCCQLKCVLTDALAAFYARLDAVTLADLVAGNPALERLLGVV